MCQAGHRIVPGGRERASATGLHGATITQETQAVQVIATHDVDDVEHWFNSPRRAEFFAAHGMTVTPFRAPGGDGKTVAVLIETPSVEALQEALSTPEAQAAETYDGVHADTIRIFLHQ